MAEQKISVNQQDLLKIAALSKLKLESSELEKLTTEFNGILKWVEEIDAVDTSGMELGDHILSSSAFMREDVTAPGPGHEKIEAMGPHFRGGFFTVPRVIE